MEHLLQTMAAWWHQLLWILTQPMMTITERTAFLRGLTLESITIRLLLAMLLGGVIGMERERKNRPAGFRTYMLVCMGSALTMLLGQYISSLSQSFGVNTDMTRISAQVINGIGFLGAGTILVTEKQQVKGLTTAAGLWASACMGLAVGAGFFACAILAFSAIIVAVLLLPRIEAFLVGTSPNMEIYVELSAIEGVHQVIACLKNQGIRIYDVDILHGEQSHTKHPNAVFSIRLGKQKSHTKVMELLSHLDTICAIKEL